MKLSKEGKQKIAAAQRKRWQDYRQKKNQGAIGEITPINTILTYASMCQASKATDKQKFELLVKFIYACKTI